MGKLFKELVPIKLVGVFSFSIRREREREREMSHKMPLEFEPVFIGTLNELSHQSVSLNIIVAGLIIICSQNILFKGNNIIKLL